jgi:hypothetical protein
MAGGGAMARLRVAVIVGEERKWLEKEGDGLGKEIREIHRCNRVDTRRAWETEERTPDPPGGRQRFPIFCHVSKSAADAHLPCFAQLGTQNFFFFEKTHNKDVNTLKF